MAHHTVCWIAAVCAALLLPGPAARGQQVTTVIVHGYSLDGSKGAWIEAMGQAMLARGANGNGAICRYDQATGDWRLVSGSLDAQQPVVLIYRWLNDFDKQGAEWGYLEGASDALYAALRDARFADGNGQPIAGFDLIDGRNLHLLGHSRGGCVVSEVAQRFGDAGITVDHVTTMDPHPVNGTLDPPFSDQNWGDPVPHRWANVTFQDNYWRADGGGLINGFDFDGVPIPNAYNIELDEDALNCCAYTFAHSDTHLWYHGTVDLSPSPCDGDQCINSTMRNTWWPDGFTMTGYFYSRLGGGTAQRPALPAGDSIEPVPVLYGGTFDMASYAGWLYHGGGGSADIVDEGGRTFLKLGSTVGANAVHNRFYMPAAVREVRFSSNIITADATNGDDALRIRFTDRDGNDYPLADVLMLDAATGAWTGPAVFSVPMSIPRDRVYTMTVFVDGGATGIQAVVGVDDLELLGSSGDLNSDGVVNVFDLFELLSAWGACAGPCPPSCAADLNGDCTVDVFDLFELLGQWG